MLFYTEIENKLKNILIQTDEATASSSTASYT